jgi:hypothetical protein
VTNQSTPLAILRVGVDSLSGQLRQDGTLYDPVFGTPTQYGSAYYAWCCAVLAGRLEDGEGYRDRAASLLSEAIDHTANPERQPYASGFDRQTLSITGRLNHRDFTWPPILKTYLALSDSAGQGGFRKRLAGVDVEASFRSRPPSNWAAVWLSGEWLRMAAGLSSTSSEELDAWIDVFFEVGDAGFDLELGMYLERGYPNAYDLFTRTHFTDLLLQGYAGRNRDRLERFLTTGLRRSLNVQLSDGSVASGYRSAGQTWVLSAQIALFTGSRILGLGSSADQEGAWLGAWRALGSLARWQRPDSYFSPVQNLLAPELRVGYEEYTADGHYSPLALGFLASAVHAGFGDDDPPSGAELNGRPATVLAEGAPTHRGAVHRGRLSMAVHAEADDSYDATGLVDMTFGSSRQLHFVSAARHLSGGPWLVPGLALRYGPGAQPVIAVGALRHKVSSGLARVGTSGLLFQTTTGDGDRTAWGYRWQGSVGEAGVELVETVPGWAGWLTLLLPYLRDLGSGETTVVSLLDSGVRFALGEEWVEFAVEGEIERGVDLPYGYESRRGLCGLVRLDLTEPGETLRWSVVSSN